MALDTSYLTRAPL